MDMPFRTINELRKAGKLDEAWNVGCPAVQENPHDSYLKRAFFWVCYGYIKQVQNSISQRAKDNGNFEPRVEEIDRINFLLDWIEWLAIPPGGYEYRSLLLICQKNLESFPRLAILLFNCRQGLFEPDDKSPYQSERGESPSLMLTFSRKLAGCWLNHEAVRQINLMDMRLFFDQVRKEARDTQHIIWLDYDEAKCLIKAGQFEEARSFIIPVLKKKQTEAWAWGALAATYFHDNPNQAITLYSHGVKVSHDEKFALKLLVGLARLLAQEGTHAQASMCVLRAVNFYQANGWRIKQDLVNLQQQP